MNRYDTTMSHSLHRPRWTALLITAVLAGMSACSAEPQAKGDSAVAPELPQSQAAPRNEHPAAGDQRTIPSIQPLTGVAIVAHHISDLSLYLEAVDRIAELGAKSIIVVTPMFQKNVQSTEIRVLPNKCPTTTQLELILIRASQHNLHTALLPIVLLEDAEEKQWRGVIEPTDWDAWWNSYDAFIDYYLDLTDRAPVDLLCIGSELNSTEDQLDRWQYIVDRVRVRFDSQITYSANWDRYDKVEFWPMVDVMSVSSYFEIGRRLEDGVDPTPANLAKAWKPDQDKLFEVARRFDKPLLLTEVGYPSLPWAARFPWNYVRADGVRTDHDAQAVCFDAFFTAWLPLFREADSPAAGFYIYAWDPYHHGQESDTGYGFRGKPAFDIIATAFRSLSSTAPQD